MKIATKTEAVTEIRKTGIGMVMRKEEIMIEVVIINPKEMFTTMRRQGWFIIGIITNLNV